MIKLRFLLGSALVVGLSVFTLAFFGKKSPIKIQQNALWTELTGEQSQQSKIPLPSFAPLIKQAEPAVLVVTTESVVKRQQTAPPGMGPFNDFFPFGPMPDSPQREFKQRGQGSGFIIHPSGLALTNNHVVEGASTIKIKVGTDLREYEAEVVGTDESTDVALIRIKGDRKDWPVLPLGHSSDVNVGDWALAIGNPLGLELSASKGMVSARGRRDVHPSGRDGLFDFLQIDAPINPGNSGGPLLNLNGEVIGVNTAISAAGQGIAFAIPIDQIKQLLPQLKETGRVARSWIGVRIEDVSPDVAKAMGLSVPHGALVREVVPEGPAAKAGLEPGDIISEFDGKLVKDAAGLRLVAGLAGVGKSMPIKVIRDGRPKNLTLTLTELPDESKISKKMLPSKEKKMDVEDLGISVVTLDDAARQQLGLDKKVVGVRIVQIDPQSIAAWAGLEANDVIIKVNDKPATNAETFSKIIKNVKKGDILRMLLKRGPSSIFVAIPKP